MVRKTLRKTILYLILLIISGCGGLPAPNDISSATVNSDKTDHTGDAGKTDTSIGHTISVMWVSVKDDSVTGYNIYHGTASGQYTDKIYVTNPPYEYNTTLLGEHYFAISSVSSAEIESTRSDESVIVVQ